MNSIENAAKRMADSYKASKVTMFNCHLGLPVREEVIDTLNDVKKLMFPAYFASKEASCDAVGFAQQMLSSIFFKIRKQIALALTFREKCDVSERAERIANEFVSSLPDIHKILLTDVDATFEGINTPPKIVCILTWIKYFCK